MPVDFSALSPSEFEALSADLIGRALGIRFEQFGEGADGGVDGRHAPEAEHQTILQAKRYEKSAFAALTRVMAIERAKIDRLAPDRYILSTSVTMTPRRKQDLMEICGPALRSTGDIFGREDLEALLRAHPDIEEAHPALWATPSGHALKRMLHETLNEREARLHAAPRNLPQVRIGVVGTKEGIGHFRTWSRRLLTGIAVPPPGPTEKKDRLHLADFAGLEATFGITFDPDRIKSLMVDLEAIERASRLQNIYEAVDAVARIYTDRVHKFRRNEEGSIDVWIFVVPEIVYERCRPESRRTGLTLIAGKTPKKQRSRSPQSFLFMDERFDPRIEDVFDDIPDFRRHIKATLLSIAPSQILRESTLEPTVSLNSAGYSRRTTQDPATVAWNIATGLYYKTQERPPWRLSEVREGVCYIGMVYKNIPNNRDNHVCCAAQMFLSEGDGVVFRGANGPWKTGEYEYHLSAAAAEELLRTVIEAYRELHSEAPKELFVHGQASFNDEEWGAFCRAVPKGTNVVGVRIRPTSGDAKLFRAGDYPVIRGTALHLDDKNAYLWTSGYVPQLDTYIGPETPNPLMVTILRAKHREPEMRTVLADLMGLTKINYNSCNFNDGLPVTVRFAKMVGDILVMGSAREGGPQPFKYYI